MTFPRSPAIPAAEHLAKVKATPAAKWMILETQNIAINQHHQKHLTFIIRPWITWIINGKDSSGKAFDLTLTWDVAFSFISRWSLCIMPNLINIQVHIDTVRGNLQSLIVGNNGSRKRGPVESTVLQTNRKQESKKASQKARKQESKPESKKEHTY